MTDGRGFSWRGFFCVNGLSGRLRAVGGLIADQYAMAAASALTRCASPPPAARQPQEQWTYRADWQDWDHRSRLAGRVALEAGFQTPPIWTR